MCAVPVILVAGTEPPEMNPLPRIGVVISQTHLRPNPSIVNAPLSASVTLWAATVNVACTPQMSTAGATPVGPGTTTVTDALAAQPGICSPADAS